MTPKCLKKNHKQRLSKTNGSRQELLLFEFSLRFQVVKEMEWTVIVDSNKGLQVSLQLISRHFWLNPHNGFMIA